MFMGEVLFKLIREGECEPELYDWAKKTIVLLDELPSNYNNFHLWVLLELSVVLGYAPTEQTLFSYAEEENEIMTKLLSLSFSEAMLLPLKGVQRNTLATSLIRYIEVHSESKININSLNVLRELYE